MSALGLHKQSPREALGGEGCRLPSLQMLLFHSKSLTAAIIWRKRRTSEELVAQQCSHFNLVERRLIDLFENYWNFEIVNYSMKRKQYSIFWNYRMEEVAWTAVTYVLHLIHRVPPLMIYTVLLDCLSILLTVYGALSPESPSVGSSKALMLLFLCRYLSQYLTVCRADDME